MPMQCSRVAELLWKMYRFHDRSKQRGNQLCVLEATLEIVKWPVERPVRERVARKSGAEALNTAV